MAPSLFSSGKAIACPYCFVDLDLRKVGYQCSGRAAVGHIACVRHPDPVRGRVFKDANPVLPPILERLSDGRHVLDDRGEPELMLGKFGSTAVCDRCGGTTALNICPGCHSLLPEELRQGAITIGVVGARNSGKTVMLSLLEQQLMSQAPGRFGVSVDHPGGTVGLAQDLAGFQRRMEDERRLPNQTASSAAKRAPAVYRWKRIDGDSRIITLYDTAGEDVANRDAAMTQQHLSAANAIILVLDPFSFAEKRRVAQQRGIDPGPDNLTSDVIDGLVTVLRQSETARTGRSAKKIATPLAVVVTKMDAFWNELDEFSPLRRQGGDAPFFDEAESQSVNDHLKALMVGQWGAAAVVNKLETEFSTVRYFAMSALGSEPTYAEGWLHQPPSPSRVLDPVLWVLNGQHILPGSAQGSRK